MTREDIRSLLMEAYNAGAGTAQAPQSWAGPSDSQASLIIERNVEAIASAVTIDQGGDVTRTLAEALYDLQHHMGHIEDAINAVGELEADRNRMAAEVERLQTVVVRLQAVERMRPCHLPDARPCAVRMGRA